MPDLPETKEIHDELLYGLKVFHSFCMQKGIHYSLHGGTLLGAIREKGFIPWDDDVDLTMLRCDYEELRKASNEIPKFGYCYLNEDGGPVPTIAVQRPGKLKTFLDIFIYDGISENKFVAMTKLGCYAFLSVARKNKQDLDITKARGQYSGVKFMLITCVSQVERIIGKKRIEALLHRLQQSMMGHGRFIHRSNDRFVGAKIILPKTVMDSYCIVPFENEQLMIMKDYHSVLVSSYGEDYMQPKHDGGNAVAHQLIRKGL